MLTLHRSAVLALSGALLLFASASAQAQNATLTVYMKAGGSGAFANSASTATQVQVYAVASAAAKYNGSTNLYAPANKTLAGGTFNQAVTGLYSPALAPGNTYQVQLNWTDNAAKQLLLGPVTLSPGANNLGAGGLGTTTPIEVTNDPPPAAKNVSCYPDLPDRSTQLYVYWSGVLLANAKRAISGVYHAVRPRSTRAATWPKRPTASTAAFDCARCCRGWPAHLCAASLLRSEFCDWPATFMAEGEG